MVIIMFVVQYIITKLNTINTNNNYTDILNYVYFIYIGIKQSLNKIPKCKNEQCCVCTDEA